jgi:hypothetical protein
MVIFILDFVVQHNGMRDFNVKEEPSQFVGVLCRYPVVHCSGSV